LVCFAEYFKNTVYCLDFLKVRINIIFIQFDKEYLIITLESRVRESSIGPSVKPSQDRIQEERSLERRNKKIKRILGELED
jgi:hypothetical protein